MSRALFQCFVVLGWLLSSSGLAAAQDNAADLYRRVVQQMDALPREVQEAWDEYDGVSTFTEKQAAAAETAEPIAKLLLAAKAIKACDWKMKYTSPWGPEVSQGLGTSRRVCRLMLMRAAYHRQNGRWKEAIDETTAAWAMGRRIGYGRLAIDVLVQQSIDAMMAFDLAAAAPAMSPEARKYALAQLDTLPEPESLKNAWGREMELMGTFMQEGFLDDVDGHMAKIVQTMELIHRLETTGKDDIPFDAAPYNSIAKLAKSDPKQFRIYVKEMTETDKKLLGAYDRYLSPVEAEQFVKEWESNLNLKNPLIEHLSRRFRPLVVLNSGASRRADVTHAMLRAGLRYLDAGAVALEQVREPGTDKTFDLVKTKAGFELRSRHFKDTRDEPWSLPFGKSAPEP